MTLARTLSTGVVTAALALTATIPATYAWSVSDLFHWWGTSKTEQQQTIERTGNAMGHRGQEREKGATKRDDAFAIDRNLMGNQPLASKEMQALLDELKTAREANDTQKVTELREKIKAQHTADQTAREAALDTAIAGGYEQWKIYATEQKLPSALVKKVTADNFTTYAALVAAQKQVRDLSEQLGIGVGMMGGVGMPMLGGDDVIGNKKMGDGMMNDASRTR